MPFCDIEIKRIWAFEIATTWGVEDMRIWDENLRLRILLFSFQRLFCMYVRLVRGHHLRIFSGYPSLQALRAETLVERFTTRSYIWKIMKFPKWFVEWLHPKSNCVAGGDCFTNSASMIHAFSIFGVEFRCLNWWHCEIHPNRCGLRCMKKVFCKYHGWTLRIKKVIRDQPPCSRRWWNVEIF